jgi:hypothetical protein
MSKTNYASNEAQNISLGQTGSIFVNGTSAISSDVSKPFIAITFLEDTVFSTASTGLVAADSGLYPDDAGTSSDISSNGAAVGSEVFPKGVTIYGRWRGFHLASGLVIAYVG